MINSFKREQKDKAPKEATFQKKLLKELRQIQNSWWTVKEAASLRGLPDIFGSINGKFIALECKRNQTEATRNTGRIVLQRKILRDIEKSGGYSAFIYPENKEEILNDLRDIR
jgi:Holliday junction resolvase